ncbi:MAG TPA: MoaD/ThiS family protein [Aestuariivirga sp.]|nr:MoaD/ThiS family protein [Alphaproteobacteria bacterium]HRX37629.1 MoaD/ThiS family protein [Aestuariivirga sp.]
MNIEQVAGIGHNKAPTAIRVEVRLFNSLTKFAGQEGACRMLELMAGATVGDLVDELKLPAPEVFLVLRNGRDVSPGLYGGGRFNREAPLDDGDVVALSGPVPYSYGYGAPVV